MQNNLLMRKTSLSPLKEEVEKLWSKEKKTFKEILIIIGN